MSSMAFLDGRKEKQLTYLGFLRQSDERHSREDLKIIRSNHQRYSLSQDGEKVEQLTDYIDFRISNDLSHPPLTFPHLSIKSEMNGPDSRSNDSILRMIRLS